MDFLLELQRMFKLFYNLSFRVYNKLERTIPGFDALMEKVRAEAEAREERRRQKREALKRAEAEVAIHGKRLSDDDDE